MARQTGRCKIARGNKRGKMDVGIERMRREECKRRRSDGGEG